MPWPTCGLRSGMWVELSAEYPHLKLKLWNPEGPSQAIDGFCAKKLRKRRVPDPLRYPLRPPFNGVADFPQGSSLKLDHPLPSQVFLIFRVLYLEAIGLDRVLHLPEVLDGAHGVGYVQGEVSGFPFTPDPCGPGLMPSEEVHPAGFGWTDDDVSPSRSEREALETTATSIEGGRSPLPPPSGGVSEATSFSSIIVSIISTSFPTFTYSSCALARFLSWD